MLGRNAYLQYKADTSKIVSWLVSASSWNQPEITLRTLLNLSNAIANRKPPVTVPLSIYRLFESVITARESFAAYFSSMSSITAGEKDKELKDSNSAHRAFIDMLKDAFEILGGKEWRTNRKMELDQEEGEEEEDDDAWVNRYAKLGASDGPVEEGDNGEEEGPEPSGEENTPTPNKRGKAKGKGKGKKGKKKLVKEQQPEPTFVKTLPLESYKIIDGDGLVTEYLIAIYNIMQEMVDLRCYSQQLWDKVIDHRLHSAVAGAMSNMTIAVIRELQFQLAIDFPGHESFGTIFDTITRGDPEKAQGMFRIGLVKITPSGHVSQDKKTSIDVKECFMAHAYWDLVAFIEDYQKNRTSKPTKGMLSKLNKWDPNFDLKDATLAKRVEWRTAYTINWLYDLINLYTSVVMQRKNGAGPSKKPEDIVLENVDWSPESKWAEHRALWGPIEFAADIAAMAMSKPSPLLKSRILPHHVFQLQCLVDSFMVAKGWKYRPLEGHVLSAPDKQFDPRYDIKHFQDRPRRGLNYSIQMFKDILERDSYAHEDETRHKHQLELLPLVQEDLNVWLGNSKLSSGLNSLPPSRFSAWNSNGLWEYSPYLCGTGLADALEFIFNYGIVTWEKHPEAMAILHLYNLLRQTGYIKKDIDVFVQCIDFFTKSLFVNGEPPTQAPHLLRALKESVSITSALGRDIKRRTPRRGAMGSTPGKGIFADIQRNIFKRKSLLTLLKGTGWRPEKIVDDDLPVHSLLNGRRLMQKRLRREKTPKPRKKPDSSNHLPPEIAVQVKKALGVPEDYKMGPMSGHKNIYNKDNPFQINNRAFLKVVQRDIIRDICGNLSPMSGISYINLLAMFMMVFKAYELKGQHIKLVRDAFTVTRGRKEFPCITLVTYTITTMDEQLLRFLADNMVDAAEHLGCGEFSYWPAFVNIWDLENTLREEKLQECPDSPHEMSNQCSVM